MGVQGKCLEYQGYEFGVYDPALSSPFLGGHVFCAESLWDPPADRTRASPGLGTFGGKKELKSRGSIIGFVDNLKVGVLGAVGVAGLFYTTYSLIDKIEEALNSIWRVQQGRPLTRKFTDYLSVVLVGPVFVFTAFGLTASAQSHWLVQQVLLIQPLGYLVVLASKLLAVFLYLFRVHLHLQVCALYQGRFRRRPRWRSHSRRYYVANRWNGLCRVRGKFWKDIVRSIQVLPSSSCF